jgi:transposase-like protein
MRTKSRTNESSSRALTCASSEDDHKRARRTRGETKNGKQLIASLRGGRVQSRCQVHKRRNVEDHLPEDMKKSAGRAMAAAYRCADGRRARRMLEALARQLERKHPAAAASLREGLDDTLTVLHFALPDGLMRTLATTNPIEFLNGRIRKTTHNVTRWESGAAGARIRRLPFSAVATPKRDPTVTWMDGFSGKP